MTPGQASLISALIETRDVDDVVVAAIDMLSREAVTVDEAGQLISVLLGTPESEDSGYRVGGVIQSG